MNYIKAFVFTFAIAFLAPLNDSCDAQVYNFFQEGTDDLLAKIELSSLPADHSAITALLFTESGQAFFGLGPTYNGTFDRSTRGMVIERSDGVLQSDQPFKITIQDDDPPQLIGFDGLPRETLFFQIAVQEDGVGLLSASFLDGASQEQNSSFGEFRAVPEPTSVVILSALGVLGAVRRRK